MNALFRLVVFATAFGFLFMTGPASHAVVLANDSFTFSKGERQDTIENTEIVGTGAITNLLGNSGLSVATLPGFGTDAVLVLSNTTNTYHRAFNGSATLTLSSLSPNQTLSLSFDIRFDGGTFGGAQNFSFGFINAKTNDSILYANLNLGGGISEFRHRAGSFNMSDAGTQLGAGWSEPPTASGAACTFQIEITKKPDRSYLIAYYRDNALIKSLVEPAGGVWAKYWSATEITGIGLRHSQTPGLKTYIDNIFISVTTSIP